MRRHGRAGCRRPEAGAALGELLEVLRRAPVLLTAGQLAAVLAALADAEAYRRERAARWCPRCEQTPEGACPEHVADMDAADAYGAVARSLTFGGPPEAIT